MMATRWQRRHLIHGMTRSRYRRLIEAKYGGPGRRMNARKRRLRRWARTVLILFSFFAFWVGFVMVWGAP